MGRRGSRGSAKKNVHRAPGRTTWAEGDAVFGAVAGVIAVAWLLLARWTDGLWQRLRIDGALPHNPWEELPRGAELSGLLIVLVAGFAIHARLLQRAAGWSRMRKLVVVALIVWIAGCSLATFPLGSPDAFHYIAEAKRAATYEANPYLSVPSQYPDDPIVGYDFLPDAPLGYGPTWLYLSLLPGLIVGYGRAELLVLGFKGLNFALLVALAGLVALRRQDRRQHWSVLYLILANPLIAFEGVASAHNDVMQAFFVVVAVVLASRGSWLSWPALALGSLVKFFSLSLGPLFLADGLLRRWGARRWVFALGASGALVAAAFAPFWSGGQVISGLARGIGDATSPFVSASLYSLAKQLLHAQGGGGVGLQVFFGLAFLALAAGIAFLRLRGLTLEKAASMTFLGFLILVSLHYPWYLVTAIPLLLLTREAADRSLAILLSCLGVLYYPLSTWVMRQGDPGDLAFYSMHALLITVPVVVALFSALRVAVRGARSSALR